MSAERGRKGTGRRDRDITERNRVEEALRESEAKYRTLFASIDEGFCIIEVLFGENEKPIDYRFLEVNPAFERQTGIENAVGRRMREIAPGHEEHWFEIYGKIALTGEPVRFENAAEQLHRYYDVFAFRIGKPAERKVAVIFNDITERRKAEQEGARLLREVERRAEERERMLLEIDAQRHLFQAIVENASVGIAVLRGPHFEYELVNPAYQNMVPGKTLLGRTVADTWPELADRVLPLLRRVLGTGEPFRATDTQFPVRRVADGPLEDVHFTFAYVPLRGIEGQADSILVLMIETTDQVRAREKIEELASIAQRRAAELQGVLDHMIDGVLVCDMSGRIIMANRASLDLLGTSNRDVIESPLAEIPRILRMRHRNGRSVAPEEMSLARALKGETVVEEDAIVYNPRIQKDIFIRTSAAPITDEQGKIAGGVSVTRDVTALTELDRLKDQFMYIAAHELKTPVAIMKGYAQALLRADTSIPEPSRKMLEGIDRGANRIDRIVKDLLDISQLHLGQLELSAESISLPEMAEEVVIRMAAIKTKHRFRVVRAEPVVVQGDRDRLEQVLFNLLDNAVKYSPRGGDIDVSIEVRDHEAVVSVRDQGVGIPREKQRHIFERFFSAHTGTPYDYGGMSVGLFISREILRRHGGRIWFESDEGTGSSFHFSLPLRGERDGG